MLFKDESIETEPIPLTEGSFRRLMELATSGVEFSFDNIMYRQTDGVSMGSPLGPALANIFVGYQERKIKDDEWPELYSRFVDDIFSHFESKELSDSFLERINGLHPALRFTREDEQQGSLPFLDVKVVRTLNGILTSLYRKPTFTGLYTMWDSYSPTLYKINLVRSLTHRVRRICSPVFLESELQTLRSILLNNGYPGHIVDRYVTPTVSNPDHFIGPKPCPVILQLPWIGKKSDLLQRKANNAVRLAYFAVKVRAIFQTSKMFSLPKDALPTQSISNVIYLYECRQCESQYVGKTTQHLGERMKQHVPRHLVDTAKRRGRPPRVRENTSDFQSSIASHLASNDDCRNRYNDADFKILARGRSQQHLNVLEALWIHKLKPALCRQKQFVSDLTLFRHCNVT